jgi:hypothetical protein
MPISSIGRQRLKHTGCCRVVAIGWSVFGLIWHNRRLVSAMWYHTHNTPVSLIKSSQGSTQALNLFLIYLILIIINSHVHSINPSIHPCIHARDLACRIYVLYPHSHSHWLLTSSCIRQHCTLYNRVWLTVQWNHFTESICRVPSAVSRAREGKLSSPLKMWRQRASYLRTAKFIFWVPSRTFDWRRMQLPILFLVRLYI